MVHNLTWTNSYDKIGDFFGRIDKFLQLKKLRIEFDQQNEDKIWAQAVDLQSFKCLKDVEIQTYQDGAGPRYEFDSDFKIKNHKLEKLKVSIIGGLCNLTDILQVFGNQNIPEVEVDLQLLYIWNDIKQDFKCIDSKLGSELFQSRHDFVKMIESVTAHHKQLIRK